MSEIKKIAVIGSGVMGMGIAAQCANAGFKVDLLDIVPDGAKDRDIVAKDAIKKALKTDPAPFMHKSRAKYVTPGNLEDHMDRLADVDWIIEVIIERADIKQDLYRKLAAVAKADAIITSNTSTIPLSILTDGMEPARAARFAITHFFNPPRYMPLLELVTTDATDARVREGLRHVCDVALGKKVIDCQDTPGFIGNRLGTLWIQVATNAAEDHDLTIEESDALAGRHFGIPSTGIFKLMDLVGLDLGPYVSKSLYDNVNQGDMFREEYRESKLLEGMIAEGYTGRKGKGGWYRLNKIDGQKVKEVKDLKTGEYRPVEKAKGAALAVSKKGARAVFEAGDKLATAAWEYMSKYFVYAADHALDIANSIFDVDEAMKTGYGFKWGPFELMDEVGPKWIADKLREEGRTVPALLDAVGDGTFYKIEDGERFFMLADGSYTPVVRPEGVLLLSDIKRRSEPVMRNGSASVWDIGDGVLCFEFTSMANSLDEGTMTMLSKTIATIDKSDDYKALVIHNEGKNFSVGANIGLMLFASNIAAWPQVQSGIRGGQDVFMKLRFGNFPVVSAPSGIAVGGGCEILMHSDAVQAHAETYTGLVEVGVGVMPGWGGCKEMIRRHLGNKRAPRGPMPALVKAFELIGTAQVAKSAMEAQRDFLIINEDDTITFNKERVLFDAKQRALGMVEGYQPPEEETFRLPGATGRAAIDMALHDFNMKGMASDYDVHVGREVAMVLTGGDTDVTEELTERDLLKLEQKHFVALTKQPKTLARLEHMLSTNKPLRN